MDQIEDNKQFNDQFPLEIRERMYSKMTAILNTHIQLAKEMGTLENAKGISDGYHTFQELYDMRLALTVALFKTIHDFDSMAVHEFGGVYRKLYRSKQHSDGSMFEGMFIVGVIDDDKQITFHYHDEYWDKFYFCEELNQAPEWDGHTDKDVIERLLNL